MSEEKPWEILFDKALASIDAAQEHFSEPFRWSIGGGTVLMFSFDHRFSKDIDIFLEEGQLLGFFNPGIQDDFDGVDSYEVSTVYVKHSYLEGDVDFIVSQPITENPFTFSRIRNREIVIQTPTEIIARKLFHRGNLATARDLYDFAVAASEIPDLGRQISVAIEKSGAVFLDQCQKRQEVLELEYLAIDTNEFKFNYAQAFQIAQKVILGKKV